MARISKSHLALLAAGIVAGCASQKQNVETGSQIGVRDDQFLPYREYISGIMRENAPLFSGGTNRDDEMLIGHVEKKNGAKSFGVQVVLNYDEDIRRQFQSARNNKAEDLKFIPIERIRSACSHRTGSCLFKEIVKVLIPEQDLRAAGPEGYPIKLFARSGDTTVINIPKPVIVSLLQKVDADPAALTATATAAR